MAAALDIITLILLVGMTFLGFRKGLAKSLLQLCGGILAIVIAFTLSVPFGQAISDSMIMPSVRKMVANEVATATNVPVDGDVSKTIENIDMQNALQSKTGPLDALLKTFGTSVDKVTEKVGGEVDKTTTEYKNKIIDAIATPVANGIGRIIAFLLLLLLASVAIFLISIPLGLVSKLPIIGGFNKLGGALLGALQGVILVFILSAFVSFLSPVIAKEGGSFTPNTIAETQVFEFFTDINPIL